MYARKGIPQAVLTNVKGFRELIASALRDPRFDEFGTAIVVLATPEGLREPLAQRQIAASRLEGTRRQLVQTCERSARLVLFRSMAGKFEPNLLYDHFRAVLNEGLFRSWSGVTFRSVSPRYARPGDIVTGYGSYLAGGRWNAPGIYAIYGSLEPGLAADESFNLLLQHFGWQNRDVPPRIVVGIRVSLHAVLDLTNQPSVLGSLNLEEASAEDWRKLNGEGKESCSQALGRAVADLAEGILAPSRIRTGNNLVIYPRSLKPDSLIEVLGEADLPK